MLIQRLPKNQALRDYEPRVTRYTSQLLAKISSSEGASLNATDWFNFYSFDVMADLAWGKSLHMLRDGVKHYYMKSLHDDMVNVGLFSHLIWLTPLFKSIPGLNAAHLQQQKWVNAQVEERRKVCLARTFFSFECMLTLGATVDYR